MCPESQMVRVRFPIGNYRLSECAGRVVQNTVTQGTARPLEGQCTVLQVNLSSGYPLPTYLSTSSKIERLAAIAFDGGVSFPCVTMWVQSELSSDDASRSRLRSSIDSIARFT